MTDHANPFKPYPSKKPGRDSSRATLFTRLLHQIVHALVLSLFCFNPLNNYKTIGEVRAIPTLSSVLGKFAFSHSVVTGFNLHLGEIKTFSLELH